MAVGLRNSAGRLTDPPRLKVQEHQEESVAETLEGQHPLTDEVALPEAGAMFLEELVPGFLGPLGTGIETSGFKDVPDIGDADAADAELLQLTHNPLVTPIVLPGELHDQTAELIGRAASATRGSEVCPAAPLGLSNPAQEARSNCWDRAQEE